MQRARGFTLTELLVALVISSLAAIAIYGAFTSLSSVSTQTRAQGNAWQQARTALAIMSEAIEGAGYGLPVNECGNGIEIGIPPTQSAANGASAVPPIAGTTSGAAAALVTPVAATAQTVSGYGYDPTAMAGGFDAGVHTDVLTVVTGGGQYGTAPVAQITSVPSTSAATFFVTPNAILQPGDMTLVTLPGSTCLLGQVTLFRSNDHVIENSGKGANTSAYNAPGGFAAANPAVTAAELMNAGVIDLGTQHFVIDTFFIADQHGQGVPSLYMQQFDAADGPGGSAPQPQLLARGVVDMRVQFGYGTYGTITQYGAPGTGPAADVLAVRLELLVRDTRTSPGTVADGPGGVPAIALMGGAYYDVPTKLAKGVATGCVAGDCAHYLYHVFDLVIPVRNDIWNQ